MKFNLTQTKRRGCLAGLVFLALLTAISAPAGTMKLELQLIWATGDSQSPDAKHKPVDQETRKKLEELPLKWANYFQVCRKCPEVATGSVKKVTMSDKCEIQVNNLGKSNLEVTLVGNGAVIWKRTQALPKGEILVLGGNAPNSTAWLVTLKRTE